VPSRRKNKAASAETWLVDEGRKPPTEADDDEPDVEVGPETQQWLAVPRPSRPGSRARREARAREQQGTTGSASVNGAASADAAEAESKRREQEFAAALKERDAELKEREAAFKEQLERQLRRRRSELEKRFEEREAELRERIEELEAELERSKGEAARKPAKPVRRRTSGTARKRTASTAKPQRRRAASSRGTDKLDLNEATFEDLRGLGLSVTQSARLIAYRDVRSGYESLDELDEIPGLSKDTLSELRSRLRLAA
jgi:DNA uptake protein ComE-like DNA-binding protein